MGQLQMCANLINFREAARIENHVHVCVCVCVCVCVFACAVNPFLLSIIKKYE